jgi:hypothetical protein
MSAVLPDEFPFTRRREPAPRPTRETDPARESERPAATRTQPAPAALQPWELPPTVQSVIELPQFVTPATAPVPPPMVVTPPPPPAVAPPAPGAAPRAVAQKIVLDEPIVQVELGGRVVYEGPERRRSPRQNLRTKALYRPENVTAAGGAVHVSNISMLGVRFWSKGPVGHGDKGTLKIEVGPLRWHSKLRIVSCIRAQDEGEGYVVGAEFVGNELPRGRTAAA